VLGKDGVGEALGLGDGGSEESATGDETTAKGATHGRPCGTTTDNHSIPLMLDARTKMNVVYWAVLALLL